LLCQNAIGACKHGKKIRKRGIGGRQVHQIANMDLSISRKQNIKLVFYSVVGDAFQIIFHAKIYVNDIFLVFKNYF
jgi:hypothetical protein